MPGTGVAWRNAWRCMALHCADGDQQEGCKPNSLNMFYHEYHSWLFPCGSLDVLNTMNTNMAVSMLWGRIIFGTLFLQVLNFSGVYSYAHLVKLFFFEDASHLPNKKIKDFSPNPLPIQNLTGKYK